MHGLRAVRGGRVAKLLRAKALKTRALYPLTPALGIPYHSPMLTVGMTPQAVATEGKQTLLKNS